jgi:thiamine biosynthesis lipoprotein
MAAVTEKPGVVARARPLLGTLVMVEIAGDGPDPAATFEAAFAACSRVEQLMHPSRAGSDLARIAVALPGQSTRVDPWTFDVLQLAQTFNRQSLGAFDPCLPLSTARLRDLESRDSRVTCRAQVALDLGGIAKGFAVDRAVDELRRLGVASGLVNAGGDLRVFGSETRAVQARAADGRAIVVAMREGAFAVSAPRSEASPAEHRGYYEGGSGTPVAGRSVAVAAPTAAVADALCKCAMLCEPTLLGTLLEAHGAQLLHP